MLQPGCPPRSPPISGRPSHAAQGRHHQLRRLRRSGLQNQQIPSLRLQSPQLQSLPLQSPQLPGAQLLNLLRRPLPLPPPRMRVRRRYHPSPPRLPLRRSRTHPRSMPSSNPASPGAPVGSDPPRRRPPPNWLRQPVRRRSQRLSTPHQFSLRSTTSRSPNRSMPRRPPYRLRRRRPCLPWSHRARPRRCRHRHPRPRRPRPSTSMR